MGRGNAAHRYLATGFDLQVILRSALAEAPFTPTQAAPHSFPSVFFCIFAFFSL